MEEKHFGPILFIPGENRGKYPACHSIYVEGAGVLIDPASDRQRLTRLRDKPGVKTVWLSHWHEDHLAHLDLFDDLPLCISEQDAPPLSDLDLFLDGYGMFDGDSRQYWQTILSNDFHFRPRKPARFLQGGETISLGTVTVEVISTPGHTPGHLSFFFRGPEVLFLGDYDLTRFGPWYGDVYSSIQETISSLERLRNISAKVWLTSHETGIFEQEPGNLWDQYHNVITERENKLLKLLDKPQPFEDIVGAWIIYGKPREPKEFFESGERGHMKKHLEKLINQGVLATEGGKYYKI
jgi:glyoxylase-like metal-dependent hydrolase (beta-lactamase superfamily II)